MFGEFVMRIEVELEFEFGVEFEIIQLRGASTRAGCTINQCSIFVILNDLVRPEHPQADDKK